MDQGIRILLIDDHHLFREGLGRLLAAEPNLRVVGNCSSVREGLAVLEREKVDVILLDYDLGGEQGISLPREAASLGFKGRTLIVTAGMSDSDMISAIRNGVSGIFLKSSTPAQLVEAINQLMHGEPWLDPKVMKAVIAAASRNTESGPPALSARERAVLKGIFEGLANKQIAAELYISESSVKAVVQQLFEKTGVRTRGQLVRVALERREQGWI